jgi:aminoglycoside 2''-phosphotransferase
MSDQGRVGEDFIGYPKIEGVLLTPRYLRSLHDGLQKEIARQLGEFLTALHAFPIDEGFELGLTEGWDGWRAKAYARFRECVAPLLSARARENALAFFERFFALEWERAVIHGDFYPPDHVFCDPETGALGVIDFGDLTIEDAATDFQSILEDFGAGFLQDVLAHYACATDAGFLERIRIRIQARPLFDAPYALEYGLQGRFRERISEIEAAFG